MIDLPAPVADTMVALCVAALPNEGCGVLASQGGKVVEAIGMTNAIASPVRYALDPDEQLAVYSALESKGQDLAAIFHSHTKTPAVPSPTDVRLATEDVPYVIVSMADAPQIRAFHLAPPDHIYEVPVRVEEAS